MPVYLLNDQPVFPPASEAEPDGLIAVGGDLSVSRLINAYTDGIFPWFEEEGTIYWFSPDPRLVLYPGNLKISPSLNRTIKSKKFEIRVDTSFRKVISSCSKAKRLHEDSTWISRKFINGYVALHQAGYAHSIEAFYEGELAGGLYGVSLGSAFFGESMFHTVTDASKVAFCHLVNLCKSFNFKFIDCQVKTDHMIRLGAESVSRTEYLLLLKEALRVASRKGKWRMEDRK
jgi:leucyl/phenylalanyl-tRNA---protein transferase